MLPGAARHPHLSHPCVVSRAQRAHLLAVNVDPQAAAAVAAGHEHVQTTRAPVVLLSLLWLSLLLQLEVVAVVLHHRRKQG
jgi:hypothetical protein